MEKESAAKSESTSVREANREKNLTMFVQVGKKGLEKEKDRIRNTRACRKKKLKQSVGEETNRTKE